MTLELETDRRLTARAEHEELRLQLGIARVRAWSRRDGARADYDAALIAFLSDPESPETTESLATASTSLAAAEHVLADISERLDINRRKAVR